MQKVCKGYFWTIDCFFHDWLYCAFRTFSGPFADRRYIFKHGSLFYFHIFSPSHVSRFQKTLCAFYFDLL